MPPASRRALTRPPGTTTGRRAQLITRGADGGGEDGGGDGGGDVKVHYRSELYLSEQRTCVLGAQETLREALDEAKMSGEDNLSFHIERIDQLRKHCDQMIIIFKVCKKIEGELVYAQKDLRQAIKRGGDSGVIASCRRRVQWLEDRLGAIVAKHSPERKYDSSPSQSMGGSAFSLRPGSMLAYSDSTAPTTTRQHQRMHSQKSPTQALQLGQSDRVSERDLGSLGGTSVMSSVEKRGSLLEKNSLGKLKSDSITDSNRYRTSKVEGQVRRGPPESQHVDSTKGRLAKRKGKSLKPAEEKSKETNRKEMHGEINSEMWAGSGEREGPGLLPSQNMFEMWAGFAPPREEEGSQTSFAPPHEGEGSQTSFPSPLEQKTAFSGNSLELLETSDVYDQSADSGEIQNNCGNEPNATEGPQAEELEKSGDVSVQAGFSSTAGQNSEEESLSEYRRTTGSQDDGTPDSMEADNEEGEGEDYSESPERTLTLLKSGRSSKFTNVTYAPVESPRGKLATAQRSRGSRVTLKTPMEELADCAAAGRLSIGGREIIPGLGAPLRGGRSRPHPADMYWESEHHRFEYSTLAPVLGQLDPNSLHQIGLARPGSYIQPVSPSNGPFLPWLIPDEDVPDIHRIALDKLEIRIHQMYAQIHSAAMLSVTVADGTKGDPRHEILDQRRVEEDWSGPTPPPPMIFHPQPLPLPPRVPITKVNRTVVYPQPLQSYIDPEDVPPPTTRSLVNQGNLYKETQMNIYKSVSRAQAPRSGIRSRLSVRRPGNTIKAITRFTQGGWSSPAKVKGIVDETWSIPLKRERVKDLERSVKDGWEEERRDAAVQLASLPPLTGSSSIQPLKEAILNESDERVQYEAMKALLAFGCLEGEVLQIASDYLLVGNSEVRVDTLSALGRAVTQNRVKKGTPVYDELVLILEGLCDIAASKSESKATKEEEPGSSRVSAADVSFEAAVLCGHLGERKECAVKVLTDYVTKQIHEDGLDIRAMKNNFHKAAAALRTLIVSFGETDWLVVEEVVKQFENSPVWEYRTEAAQLLQRLGSRRALPTDKVKHERLYTALERRLWDDSQEIVRLESAKTIIVLNMFIRASESVTQNLQDPSSTVRMHAVASLATLGIKTTKVIKQLAEMLELDPSENVRKHVIRSIGVLGVPDKRILRLLHEREKTEGILGREAARVLRKVFSAQTSGLRR